jgi:hypothetical protein
LAPIQFFTPTSTDERMREVAALAKGFMYCVARRGVTGKQTTFDDSLATYLTVAARLLICPWRLVSESAAGTMWPCCREGRYGGHRHGHH